MPDESKSKSVTYADAGVDISSGDRAKERIKYLAQKTFNRNVLGGIGGFGAIGAVNFIVPVEPGRRSNRDRSPAGTKNRSPTEGQRRSREPVARSGPVGPTRPFPPPKRPSVRCRTGDDATSFS